MYVGLILVGVIWVFFLVGQILKIPYIYIFYIKKKFVDIRLFKKEIQWDQSALYNPAHEIKSHLSIAYEV